MRVARDRAVIDLSALLYKRDFADVNSGQAGVCPGAYDGIPIPAVVCLRVLFPEQKTPLRAGVHPRSASMAQVSDVVCPTCHAAAAMRISRSGFLQVNVLGRLGIYPWKCGACGATFLSRKRRRKVDPRLDEGDPGKGQQERRA